MTAATGPPGAEANIGSTRLDHWNWNGMEDWVDDIWFLCWSACSRIDDFLDYVLRLLFLGLFLEMSHSQNGKSRNDCRFLSSHIRSPENCRNTRITELGGHSPELVSSRS